MFSIFIYFNVSQHECFSDNWISFLYIQFIFICFIQIVVAWHLIQFEWSQIKPRHNTTQQHVFLLVFGHTQLSKL